MTCLKMIKLKNFIFFNDKSFDAMVDLLNKLEILDLSYTSISNISLEKIIKNSI